MIIHIIGIFQTTEMTKEWETSKGLPEMIDKEDLEHFTEASAI